MLLAQALHAEACAKKKKPPIMDKGLRFHLASIQMFQFTLPRYQAVKPFRASSRRDRSPHVSAAACVTIDWPDLLTHPYKIIKPMQ